VWTVCPVSTSKTLGDLFSLSMDVLFQSAPSATTPARRNAVSAVRVAAAAQPVASPTIGASPTSRGLQPHHTHQLP
ncbi:MAG: hypothetical protein KA795_15790, partial [Burkholderiaceae bacterium]|nr:hypothetical protein [Burkholderiaceae bacterium]